MLEENNNKFKGYEMRNIIVVYTNSNGVHLHTWETCLPLSKEDIEEAVYSTGLVEDDDFKYTIEVE